MKRVLIILLVISVTASAASFSDIGNYTWASEAIEKFSTRGIISGMGDGTFKPADNVTRGQFAKMLALCMGLDVEVPRGQTYTDVSSQNIYYKYIEAVTEFLPGYINENSVSVFRPDEAAKREDIAAAISLALDLPSSSGSLKNFSDNAEVSFNLIPHIEAAVKNGIIKGFEDKTLRPQSPVTRAEAVVMLERAGWGGDMAAGNLPIKINVLSPERFETTQAQIWGTVEGVDFEGLNILVNQVKASVKKEADGNISWSTNSRKFPPGKHTLEILVISNKGEHTFSHTISCASEPVITLQGCPASTQMQTLNITINVKDEFSNISDVWVDGQEINIPANQKEVTANATIFLFEGANIVTIKALSSAQGTSEKTVTIYREPPFARTAAIVVGNVRYDGKSVTLSGFTKGAQSGAYVMVGGAIAYVAGDGSWNITLDNLSEGEQIITITMYLGGFKVAQTQKTVTIK